MSDIIVDGYTDASQATIRATIDGIVRFVPAGLGGPYRQVIADWEAEGNVIPPHTVAAPASADVDAERDRRIAAGFVFGGVAYQSRPEDRENISGASTAALAAIVGGAQPGDLRWHGSDTDFTWIAVDNSLHTMDAQTMFAFGQAAMHHKERHIFAARALKDMDPIPADFADHSRWP